MGASANLPLSLVIRRLTCILPALLAALLLAGCATSTTSSRGTLSARPTPDRLAMYRAIPAEPRGDYWIGRRFHKEKLGVWGYIRRPGQPWHEAQLVLMNENQKFAYDREQARIGIDDNYEYRLYGRISGQRIYEPSTNSWYDEFLLRDYEIISTNPPSIFGNNYVNNKQDNLLVKPEVVDLRQWQDAPAPLPGQPPAYGATAALGAPTPGYQPPVLPASPVQPSAAPAPAPAYPQPPAAAVLP